ncbi:MAG: DUF3422 family protein [Moraxellaceae bacterium]|nr:DUF3422 family protein [Moraxellaceae bacterium]
MSTCRPCERYAVPPPARGSSCYYQDFGGFELRWERHRIYDYTVIHRADKLQPLAHTALSLYRLRGFLLCRARL